MCKCEFDTIMQDYAGDKSQLIPILQKLQDAYGYLEQGVIARLSEKMEIPVSEIMGVVTFYGQFRLTPIGENVIKICFGTACHVLGAGQVADAICRKLDTELGVTTADGKFTVESVACIGCCSLAPVLTLNEETHGRLTPDTARQVIQDFRGEQS